MSEKSKILNFEVNWIGREQLWLELEVDQEQKIKKSSLKGIGGTELLTLIKKWRPKIIGLVSEIEIPEGQSSEVLVLRELLLKAKGEWKFPYDQEELCHCRAIPTARVDMAICAGAKTLTSIREKTSANTACGTCAEDIKAILKFRLGS